MRVVLDTTVLVSGFLFGGVPGAILNQAAEGAFTPVISPTLLEEFAHTLAKPKFHKRGMTQDVIDLLRARLERVSECVPGQLKVPEFEPDPNDTHILACVAEASADYLVTGDHALLALGTYAGALIVSPRQFIEILETNA